MWVRTELASALARAAGVCALLVSPHPAAAFFEDLCVEKDQKFEMCVEPFSACKVKPRPNGVCPMELAEALASVAKHVPGRSMIHADATYFLAQAPG